MTRTHVHAHTHAGGVTSLWASSLTFCPWVVAPDQCVCVCNPLLYPGRLRAYITVTKQNGLCACTALCTWRTDQSKGVWPVSVDSSRFCWRQSPAGEHEAAEQNLLIKPRPLNVWNAPFSSMYFVLRHPHPLVPSGRSSSVLTTQRWTWASRHRRSSRSSPSPCSRPVTTPRRIRWQRRTGPGSRTTVDVCFLPAFLRAPECSTGTLSVAASQNMNNSTRRRKWWIFFIIQVAFYSALKWTQTNSCLEARKSHFSL